MGFNALFLRLRQRLILHVVAKEVVQARDLIDEGEVIILERCHVCLPLLPLETFENDRTPLIHVNDQVL